MRKKPIRVADVVSDGGITNPQETAKRSSLKNTRNYDTASRKNFRTHHKEVCRQTLLGQVVVGQVEQLELRKGAKSTRQAVQSVHTAKHIAVISCNEQGQVRPEDHLTSNFVFVCISLSKELVRCKGL